MRYQASINCLYRSIVNLTLTHTHTDFVSQKENHHHLSFQLSKCMHRKWRERLGNLDISVIYFINYSINRHDTKQTNEHRQYDTTLLIYIYVSIVLLIDEERTKGKNTNTDGIFFFLFLSVFFLFSRCRREVISCWAFINVICQLSLSLCLSFSSSLSIELFFFSFYLSLSFLLIERRVLISLQEKNTKRETPINIARLTHKYFLVNEAHSLSLFSFCYRT